MSSSSSPNSSLLLPHPDVDYFLSCVVGNSHIYWAQHGGIDIKYRASLYWRTPPVDEDEAAQTDPAPADEAAEPKPLPLESLELDNYVADAARGHLFGENLPDYKRDTLVMARNARRMPMVPVYVVATNLEHVKGLERLFHRFSFVQMIKLKPTDFWTDGVYPGLGTDRVAAIKAAIAMHGLPAMVIDGGTATTFTVAGPDGTIEGGGICPGLQMSLGALHENTGALPLLQAEEVAAMVQKCKEEERGLERYCSDTRRAMVSCVLQGIKTNIHGILKRFGQKMKPLLPEAEENVQQGKIEKANTDLKVCITGGDGQIITELMQPNHSNILEMDDDWTPPADVSLEQVKHLIHQSISTTLEEGSDKRETGELEGMRNQILGQRVVVKIGAGEDSGEEKMQRGTVLSVARGPILAEDEFWVKFDVVDIEDMKMNASLLRDCLVRYGDEGETQATKNHLNQLPEEHRTIINEAFVTKRDLARVAASVLTEQIDAAASGEASAPKRSAPASDETPDVGKKRKTSEKTVFSPDVPKSEAPMPVTEEAHTSPPQINSPDPESFIGERVAKYFDKDVYYGRITRYIPPEANAENIQLWHVMYDDEDEEDYDESELKVAMELNTRMSS